MSPRFNNSQHNGQAFEVRFKTSEGIFSKHFITARPEQAADRARSLGRVVSVRKVNFWDVFGNIETMSLKEIVFGEKKPVEKNPMLADETLEGILFPKKLKRRSNNDTGFSRGRDSNRGDND